MALSLQPEDSNSELRTTWYQEVISGSTVVIYISNRVYKPNKYFNVIIVQNNEDKKYKLGMIKIYHN